MTALIRTATVDDARAVDRVCRATAEAGHPQPDDIADPALVSLVYALPYLHLEPSTARVLIQGGEVTGYVVGALDSLAFYRRWTSTWAPRHLPRPDGADPELVSLLREPMSALPPAVQAYPSHLHINLLPPARGGGWGSRLLTSFLAGLADGGSPGVHLRVDVTNEAATAWYSRLGFTRVPDTDTDTDTDTMVRPIG